MTPNLARTMQPMRWPYRTLPVEHRSGGEECRRCSAQYAWESVGGVRVYRLIKNVRVYQRRCFCGDSVAYQTPPRSGQ